MAVDVLDATVVRSEDLRVGRRHLPILVGQRRARAMLVHDRHPRARPSVTRHSLCFRQRALVWVSCDDMPCIVPNVKNTIIWF
jgi:hypothetical protein